MIDINNSEITLNQENKGFLIKNISKEKISNLISDSKINIILAARNDNEILGYLIARLSNTNHHFK